MSIEEKERWDKKYRNNPIPMHIAEWMDENICGEKSMRASMVAKKKRGGMTDDDFWA